MISGELTGHEISRLGLEALTQALNARTSFLPGDPVGVDPAKDELAFYPLLYWPIVASAPQPPAKTVAKVTAYMKQGGTIIFDTRDALSQHVGGAPTPEGRRAAHRYERLGHSAAGSDAARSRHHQYFSELLDGFVGRYANGETGLEALPPEPKDSSCASGARNGQRLRNRHHLERFRRGLGA